jgi:hypothetical protein
MTTDVIVNRTLWSLHLGCLKERDDRNSPMIAGSRACMVMHQYRLIREYTGSMNCNSCMQVAVMEIRAFIKAVACAGPTDAPCTPDQRKPICCPS